jgi:uncharacterized protein (TIGR03083 family)
MDIWPVVHAERKAFVTDLSGLDANEWSTTSLATDWTVRDVVAHMTATAKITPAGFFPKLASSGFSFSKMQAKDIAAASGGSAADTLANFDAIVSSTGRPPGPPATMLGETIVHSQDVRGALGIQHDYPMPALVQVADFYKGSNLLIGTKKRIAGLTLKATDTEWSHGTGPEVTGPMLALVMAMTGRKVTDQLTGDGVETLRSRP